MGVNPGADGILRALESLRERRTAHEHDASGKPSSPMPVDEDRDHIQGPADAAVTLVEYGDYECPYCGAGVSDRQGGAGADGRAAALRVPELPAHDLASARRAGRGGRRGRRPPRAGSGRCTTSSTRTSGACATRTSRAYAEQLGLDVERFDKEMAEHAHAARVHEDFMSGVRSGVNGTPTFYVNGVRHDDSYDADTLLEALERAASS